MPLFGRFKTLISGKHTVSVLVLFILGGLIWELVNPKMGATPTHIAKRTVEGVFYGDMPAPTEPSITGTVKGIFAPEQQFRLMTIKHIARIAPGTPMPHPFVGKCNNCHLYVDGPGPGKQYKTPVGAVLEKISGITKLGPPLLPSSDRPHPPAGRCIKCHDMVVKIPVKKKTGGFRWIM